MKRMLALLLCLAVANTSAADDFAHRKAVDELMSATQAESIVEGWRKRYEAQAEEVIVASLGGRSEAQLNEAQREAIQRFRIQGREALARGISWKSMQEAVRLAYMKVFTESEALELAAFYRTSLGRKLLQGLPQVSDGIARAVRSEVDGMRPELQKIGAEFTADFERMAGKVAAPQRASERKAGPGATCRNFNPKTGCRN